MTNEQPKNQVRLDPHPGLQLFDSLLDAAAWRGRTLDDPVWRQMYEALPDLTELFPHATPEEVRDAEQRASELVGAAFFAADLGKGEQYLKTTFPGFKDETYSMVYGFGCWLAR